jgi:hypothetical protein
MVGRTLILSLSVTVAAATRMLGYAAAPTPEEIIRNSVASTKANWAQASKYSYVERDVEDKRHNPPMSKTYRVVMIEGSPYNVVTAVNDRPVSPDEKAAEERKLRKEIERRQKESERERERRVAKYEKERNRDHRMLQEMVDAFEFTMAGETQIDGHQCWIMNAEPKPGFEPGDHEGHVLKGMKGQLWIDKASYQWVKVHAEVVRPVSFFGFLAKVGPGTAFDLQQEPIADGVWLPKAFNVRVRASALGFVNENSEQSETYLDYQPMPQALALLESTK